MAPRVTALRQQQAGAARAGGPAAAVVLSQQAQEAAEVVLRQQSQEAAEVVPGVTESPGRRSGRNHSASSASSTTKTKRDLPSEETKSPAKKKRSDLPSEENNVGDAIVVGSPATATLGSGKEAVEENSTTIEEESQVPILEAESKDAAEDHGDRRLRSRVGSHKNYNEDSDDNEDEMDSDEGEKTPGKNLPVLQRLKKGRQMKPFSPQGPPCYNLVFCICLMSHTLSFSSYLRQ